jgi:hypothetical protein
MDKTAVSRYLKKNNYPDTAVFIQINIRIENIRFDPLSG